MKTLYVLVGLPRSNKTEWAKAQGSPIVSGNAVRRALALPSCAVRESDVWATAHIMVRALFDAGHDSVIIDSCNSTVKQRDDWQNRNWRRVFVRFFANAEDCAARASSGYSKARIFDIASKFEDVTTAEMDQNDQILTVYPDGNAPDFTGFASKHGMSDPSSFDLDYRTSDNSVGQPSTD